MAREPKAEVEISAHSRGLAAKLREARAKFANFGGELKKHVFGKELIEKGFWGKAGAQMVGNLGANVLGAVGGALFDQGKQIFEFEKGLTRLGIAAGKSPEFMRAFANSVRQTSSEVGISANEVLGAARAYVALTGDMDGAAAATRTWARVAQATDSNVADVARTAAALKQNLKIDPRDMEAAFSALATQGKMGAIELRDLAGQLANIAPQWARFKGGTGVGGLKEMGAALQVIKQGFGGDASETVTGLQSMLTAIVKNSHKFKGVKIFEKDPVTGAKVMRNVLDIVRDIGNSKLAKDPKKLADAFGRVEASRAFEQLSQNKQLLDELIAKSGDTQVIQRDLERYMLSPAGKLERAFEQLKNKIAEAATPERIEAFTEAVIKLADALSAVVGFISDMPKAMDLSTPIADMVAKDVLARADAKKLTPEQRAKLADELEQKAANVTGDDPRALGMRRGLFDATKKLREQAAGKDAWLSRESTGIMNPAQLALSLAKFGANPQAAVKDVAKDVRGGVRSVAGTLPGGEKAMLQVLQRIEALLAKGTKVEIDGAPVVRAMKGSREHARNPRA